MWSRQVSYRTTNVRLSADATKKPFDNLKWLLKSLGEKEAQAEPPQLSAQEAEILTKRRSAAAASGMSVRTSHRAATTVLSNGQSGKTFDFQRLC